MQEQPSSFGAQEFSSSGSVNATVQGTQSDIRIIPAKILKALLLIIFVILALHLVSLVMKFGFDAVTGYGFITLFDLNTEANIPTYLSSALMTFCAIFMVLIYVNHKELATPWYRYWAFLALIFAIMSVDEIAQLHERSIEPLKHLFGIISGDLLTNAWVILAFVFLPLMALVYLRFLMAMESRSALLFIASGIVFVSGVVGVEIISGVMKGLYSTASLAFAISTTVEETLELLGLALFVYALTDYAARQRNVWRFSLRERSG